MVVYFKVVSSWIGQVTNRLSIRNKIICGQAVALSVAVLGTTAGLAVGNYYQQQASAERDIANKQGRLLTELQVSLLETRPVKEFRVLIEKPKEFEQHRIDVMQRPVRIKALISELQSSSASKNIKGLPPVLQQCDRASEEFYQAVDNLARAALPLISERKTLPAASKLIGEFAGNAAFDRYLQAAYKLTAFIKIAQQQDDAAARALSRAEELRSQIIIASIVLSVAMAVMLASFTSAAIVRPLQAVTEVAIATTHESKFNRQVSVTTEDEVGLLATSLNQLIQTVRIQLEELKQTQAQLIQTEKMSSLGQMVAGVAHEINTLPVSFIYSNLEHAKTYANDLLELAQLYQEQYPKPTPAIQKQLAAIDLDFLAEDFPKILTSMKIGADRIRNIVQSLRNFSHLDEAEIKSVNLNQEIENTLLILNHKIENSGIEIIKSYENSPEIECYPALLNQVFMNILDNAIDELKSQKENPQRQIFIQTEIKATDAIVRIRDNGRGVPSEIKEKLFDPFFTTKPVGQGTGLGLAIAYPIVKKHGGNIEVNSELGQGAEFAVILPIKS